MNRKIDVKRFLSTFFCHISTRNTDSLSPPGFLF